MFAMFRGSKSGNYATTLYNCLLNALIWRYIFVVLARDARVNFGVPMMDAYKANVEDAYVGDDCHLAVSALVAPWYNQFTTSQAWYIHFGIVLTDPDKGEITRDFIPYLQTPLIKRLFKWDRKTRTAMGPLPKQIIQEMCMWCTDARFDARNVSATVASACLEAAQHDREYYNYVVETLRAACAGRVKFCPLTYDRAVVAIKG
jgi:hypothetical protein